MAKKDTPAVPSGPSDPSTVSAAAVRLGLLLAKIRDELRQFLDAFQCAISGKGNVNWHGFCLEVPDPGNGGTISFPEETPHVTLSNLAIFRFNIPVSETDIDTAARYLEDFDLPHDAKRLRDEFQDLKHAFCSLGDWVQHSDGVVTNRKFYAQACAAALWEHVNQLIGTVEAMSPPPTKADESEGNGGAGSSPASNKVQDGDESEKAKQKPVVESADRLAWFTQHELADYCKVNPRTAYNWLNGRTGSLRVQEIQREGRKGVQYLLKVAEVDRQQQIVATRKARLSRKQE